jgi:hypothetical protein
MPSRKPAVMIAGQMQDLPAGDYTSAGILSGDPASPADGAIWFNAVTGTLRMAQQGQVVDVTSLGPLYARFLVMN